MGILRYNPRGEDLLAYCVSADLNFCNLGNKLTFRTKTRKEVLDLTLLKRCAWYRIVGWHDSNVLSFSNPEVESRTQGSRPRTQKYPRPRAGMLEAKDQEHSRKCSPKKKGLEKSFSGNLQFIGVARIFDW